MEAIATIRRPRKINCSRILYGELINSFSSYGCPICRLTRHAEEKAITTLMYERVNDPSTRNQLLRSNGFCPFHAWMVVELYRRGPDTSIEPLGLTIILADILKHEINNIKKDNLASSPAGECIICKIARETEKSYLDSFINCINDKLLKEYSTGKSILCIKHYALISLNLYDINKELAKKLKEIQLNKLNKLYTTALQYIKKTDYRSIIEPSNDEATAWFRILEFLDGYKTSTIIKSC